MARISVRQLFERERLLQRERPGLRALQCAAIGKRAERTADVAHQRAHIRALAAGDLQFKFRRVITQDVDAQNVNLTRRHINHFACASAAIERLAVDFDGRMCGRDLLDFTDEPSQRRVQLRRAWPRVLYLGALRRDLAFGVAGVGLTPSSTPAR